MTGTAPSRGALTAALVVGLAAVSSAALWIRLAHAWPLAIAFYRLLYATALLAPFSLGRVRAELPALDRRGRRDLALSGVALALHFASWIASLAPASPYATSVAASATLVALHPVLVALATPVLLGRPVPRGARAGIALALAGAAVLALGDAHRGNHRLVGDLLALGGAVAGAAYFVLGARLRGRLGLRAYVLPVYAIAAATLGLLALATGASLRVTDPREHALFLALAVGPMVLGHTLFNWSLRYLPAWLVSATILGEPVASSVLVLAVVGEVPPVSSVVGAAVVLAGLAVTTRAAVRSANPVGSAVVEP